jgi:hypothetical protein
MVFNLQFGSYIFLLSSVVVIQIFWKDLGLNLMDYVCSTAITVVAIVIVAASAP